jgi:predicted acetyltransferase
MIQCKSYVRENEHGFRVGACDISLESIVIPFKEGESAEAIQQNFPDLTLEEVYGAITFYLANKEAVEAYLLRQEAIWDELRQTCDEDPSPVVSRLRALAATRAKRTS